MQLNALHSLMRGVDQDCAANETSLNLGTLVTKYYVLIKVHQPRNYIICHGQLVGAILTDPRPIETTGNLAGKHGLLLFSFVAS